MATSFLSIAAGYAAWTVVFLGGSAGLRAAFAHGHEGGTSSAGLLAATLALSVAASAVAGGVTARLAPGPIVRHVWILAGLLLATGIPVQIGAWELLPVAYHVLFLGALVPVTVAAGRWQAVRVWPGARPPRGVPPVRAARRRPRSA